MAAESVRSSTASQSSGVNSPENRGAVEERAALVVERREDLAAQVLAPRSAGRPPNSRTARCRILDGPKPEPGENERGRPSLGALDQQLELLRAEPDVTALDEELSRLREGERQLARAHLRELASGPQPREPQRRIRARAHDHAAVRRETLERIVDGRQAFRVGHGVEVVEHDDDPVRERVHAVHELVDGRLDRAAGDAEPLERTAPEPLTHPIDGGGDVRPEPNRIVVELVEGDPGERVTTALAPAAHGRRLPVPGRGRDERQRRIDAPLQRPPDPRPVDHAGTNARNRQLRLGQRQRRLRAG